MNFGDILEGAHQKFWRNDNDDGQLLLKNWSFLAGDDEISSLIIIWFLINTAQLAPF